IPENFRRHSIAAVAERLYTRRKKKGTGDGDDFRLVPGLGGLVPECREMVWVAGARDDAGIAVLQRRDLIREIVVGELKVASGDFLVIVLLEHRRQSAL